MDFVKCCKCENSVNNLENYPSLRDLLPKNFIYRICDYVPSDDEGQFDTRFRVNCSKDNVDEWFRKFQEVSKNTFKISQTFSKNSKVFLYKVALRCHHNTQPRSHNVLNPHYKHTDCPARMRITVKSTEKSRQYKSVDVHLTELPTLVILHYKHNHHIHNYEALKHREPTDEVRRKFLKMFEAGHTPSHALDIHRGDLYHGHEDDDYHIAGDRAHCPDISWVYHLYYSVFKEKYGSGSGAEMLKSFETIVLHYNVEVGENCAAYKCLENNAFVIAIMSPLMKRILKTLSAASEVVFVDSFGNIDRFGCRIFLLIVNTSAGGFPIGILISTSESEAMIYEALTLYKTFIEPTMFSGKGLEGPSVFMTGDSTAERVALAKSFPNSIVHLCIFHVLQASWSYLWDSSTGISLKDRQELFFLIKRMVYADSIEEINTEYQTLASSSISKQYCKFINYAEQLYKRQEEWALCHQKATILRGQNANNLCEAAIRVLKDKVLLRTKAYNVAQLLDFLMTDLNNFYVKKAIDVANGRPSSYLQQKREIQEKKLIPVKSKQISDSHFEVTNINNNKIYFVDIEIGLCNCILGQSGALCKHQQHIAIKYNKQLDLVLPTNECAKKQFYYIATGNESTPQIWFKDLTEITASSYISHSTTVPSCVENKFDILNNEEVNNTEAIENSKQNIKNEEVNNSEAIENRKQNIAEMIDGMCELIKLKAQSSSEMLEAAEKMVLNFENIKTDANLVTALSTFGKYSGLKSKSRLCSNKKIGVQPTAIMRRKTACGGRKCVTSGRVPKLEFRKEHAYSKVKEAAPLLPQKRKVCSTS